MKKKIHGPHSEVIALSKKWSGRARRLITLLPYGSSILDLYWWHWSRLGKDKHSGFPYSVTGMESIGMKTYEEIRMVLMQTGFPDLSDGMFSPPGFCSKCCPKSLLEKVLTEWIQASRSKRAKLRKEIDGCCCDGH